MNCCLEDSDHINLNIVNNRIFWPVFVRGRIPRPPNAFMLYANDHRKTLAHLYPTDSNKEISRRLGHSWKDLNLQEKNKYFQKAKDIDQEHKLKYPGYVYNPKDARRRKAIRTNLKDRGATSLLPRSFIRKMNNATPAEIYQNLIMANPLTQIGKLNPMWNGLDNGSCSDVEKPSTVTSPEKARPEKINHLYKAPSTTTNNHDILPMNLMDASKEERTIFEKEKSSLEAAEKYTKVGKYEEIMRGSYLPISATKFITDPELFTNNSEYHKEYIIKYFNHIPDYETYNVITEDGMSFPYVTIPNLIVRQNINDLTFMN